MKNKIVVAISCQYGSGGYQIAKKLAETLELPLYSREYLLSVGEEKEWSDVFGEYKAEQGGLLYALSTGTEHEVGSHGAARLPEGDTQFFQLTEAVKSLLQEGGCVMIADECESALREAPNQISVFICADREDRVRRVAAREKIPFLTARQKLERIDKKRACYCDFHTGEKWGKPERYSLCINSSAWGIDGAVDAIRLAVDRKTKCI